MTAVRLKKIAAMAGALVISAGVLAACGGSSSDSAMVTVNGTEPESGLVTTNTNENGGGRIVDRLFTGLYYYDADGNPKPAMVDKLETTDSQNYTVTIKEGWKFTDGTPVNAKQLRRRLELRRALHQRSDAAELLRPDQGLRRGCRRQADGTDHVGSEGRRRLTPSPSNSSSPRSTFKLGPRLHPVLPAARRSRSRT